MVLLATTVKQDLVARLAPHHLELVNGLIEAEVLRNDAVKKALASKVNETLKGFGIQDVGAKTGK
jgi:hypothetical protein